jgi:acyl carrier protein
MHADWETSRERLTATEQVVATLWTEVLQTSEPIQPADNFFALGGDSNAMVTVLFRLNAALRAELPTEVMLNAPSLREFAALVDRKSQESVSYC